MTEHSGTFEEKLQEVQEIISRIEEGKLPLEDCVRQFEDGMKTLASLEEELKEMNRKLTVLRDGQETEMSEGAADEDV
jgi:exodeoxyribonuclease VII small subunit